MIELSRGFAVCGAAQCTSFLLVLYLMSCTPRKINEKSAATFVEGFSALPPAVAGTLLGAGLCSQAMALARRRARNLRMSLPEDWSNNSVKASDSLSGMIATFQFEDEMDKTELWSAFTSLDASDKYDAVLTGLCAKILDDTPAEVAASQAPSNSVDGGEQQQSQAPVLIEPSRKRAARLIANLVALLEEMNNRRVPASPRSLLALLDVSILSPSGSLAKD
jgi:hypothetical protein